MKLLYCTECHCLFKLTRNKLRTCDCGKVQGRYRKNGRDADSKTATYAFFMAGF